VVSARGRVERHPTLTPLHLIHLVSLPSGSMTGNGI
jgi:hypothetical protein